MEPALLLPLIGVGVVVVMAGFGTAWCVVTLRRRRTWAQTMGTIIGSELRVSTASQGGSGSSRALIIEWLSADGSTLRYTENFSVTRFNVPVGKRVRLYVHPRYPHRATRALVAPGVLFGVTGAVIGVAFTAISILVTR
ncbi:DUF3592 domain-containing protein [Pseudactinotalea sp.]|uniref:DUF3592 domain-containing protein n=1 Tax=Pseudactinotalea sp. TaxID=1926260 RepID=UPI003B3B03C4